MRFLFRCALLGTVLTAFLLVLAIQRHSVKRSSSSSSTTVGWHAAPGYGGNAADAAAASSKSAEQKQHRQELPTNEDHEIRRLLLAGAASADETAPASQLDGASSAEMAPALMLRFPRFPPAIGGGGGGTSGAEMTLNVAIVLLVSLLSIAILITAICCVIIVALALDTSTARRWSARPSMAAATSADFMLSSWPDMATQYHQLSQSPIYRTPGLDKLFQQQQQQHHHHDYSLQQADLMAILHDAPVDTPPLTDDDYEVSDDWHGHVQGRGEHGQRRNSFTV
ncbi:hypothetical protein GPALN_004124 [Globodera pallida]|nr:hypothetical protein GPALN_004124 [Globodera pallida]